MVYNMKREREAQLEINKKKKSKSDKTNVKHPYQIGEMN